MKSNLFKPLLVILMLTLAIKASMLFGKVQEHAGYVLNTSVKSVLVDSAYATASSDSTIGAPSSPNPHNKTPDIQENKLSNTTIVNKETQPVTAIPIKSESGVPIAQMYNASEVKLLQELSKRREILDKALVDVNVKEQVLKVTEDKINQKLVQLKAMQDKIDDLMKQYNDKERLKIMSLVKIYENMKPKDAAKIFDELDMPVLIQVVSNMKELKAAPVIASMNPTKARDLSTELAKQKNIIN